jgi:GT2 family glycosyltransferase
MKTAIIIPNYIATEELRNLATNAIKSMRATSDVFIICVNDGSPLNVSFLEELADHTIHLQENSGFAVASNTGLRYALEQGFDYIGCANNDI